MGEMCLNGNLMPNYILPRPPKFTRPPKTCHLSWGVVGIFPLCNFKMDFQLDAVSAVPTQLQFPHQVLIEIHSQLMQAK